ncbi:MAG: hypothetical protein JSS66_14605 [Armatimonadetes bacterium]|nr:hypothetical protein [Armatimonadota bacterium]
MAAQPLPRSDNRNLLLNPEQSTTVTKYIEDPTEHHYNGPEFGREVAQRALERVAQRWFGEEVTLIATSEADAHEFDSSDPMRPGAAEDGAFFDDCNCRDSLYVVHTGAGNDDTLFVKQATKSALRQIAEIIATRTAREPEQVTIHAKLSPFGMTIECRFIG